MQPLQNVSQLQFRVETIMVRNGRKLGKIRPDESGYYKDVPIAALGIVSRNKTYYDVSAFVQQLSDPNTAVNMKLTSGQLYGEYGHPDLIGLSHDNQIMRLAEIREQNHSHHFRSIQTGKDLESGGKLLVADIKPTGPYGFSLKESFDDPFINTAFSLRAITASTIKNNVSYRTMRSLVTFDAVGCGGYLEASKQYAPATESLDVDIIAIDKARFTQVALENFTDTEWNDIFESPSILKKTTTVTVVKAHNERFSSIPSTQVRSFYHEKLKS